jgi:ferric-dicitrate binding protein FerR (iron transport regulator)
VALVRGLIEVTDKLDKSHKVLLKPNEKLVFSTNPAKGHANFMVFSLAENALLTNTKWIADTLVFRKEKLKDLALRMEKKYDLKIEVHSELLKEKRFSGTFTDETIHQALEALKLSYPLTYTINNRLVIIKD